MPKVVTIVNEAERSVTPYRAAPVRRPYKVVGPSSLRQYAALAWVCGATGVTAVWLPWYIALVSNGVVWTLLFSWARAWRTARLWQRVAYQHSDDLPTDLELDKPFSKQLLEEVAAATAQRASRGAVRVPDAATLVDEDVPPLTDAARKWLAVNDAMWTAANADTSRQLDSLRSEISHMQEQLTQQRFEYDRMTRTLGHELAQIYTQTQRSKT